MDKQNFVYFLPLYIRPRETHSFLLLEYLPDNSILSTRLDSTDKAFGLAEQVLKKSKRNIVIEAGGQSGRNFFLRLYPLLKNGKRRNMYQDRVFLSSVFSIYAFDALSDENYFSKQDNLSNIIACIHSPASVGGMRPVSDADKTIADALPVPADKISYESAVELYNHPVGVALRLLAKQVAQAEAVAVRNDTLDVFRTETLIVYIVHGLFRAAQSPFVPLMCDSQDVDSCSSFLQQEILVRNSSEHGLNASQVISEAMKTGGRGELFQKFHPNLYQLVQHINEFLDRLEDRGGIRMLPPVFRQCYTVSRTSPEKRVVYLLNFLTDVWKSVYVDRKIGQSEMYDTSRFAEHIQAKLGELLKC